ncbi:Polyhydroxyalkanoate synthesis regulator phasin [Hymenobacter gelipurpurascens]|uniref:Polyhydroxyalkanoate synthesis regulator phasin n=1 Tax=Hymenobacter gelipurpurascens TaxID=89968 RepID=A0A212T2R9_9BACT|nr:hypothetical protein [Hymenobacter gelipurpurascens]SNC60140.1 Polyhydroxyalkanoate synthesis regulator phasin [Hymenobacter gelipurpurascens]
MEDLFKKFINAGVGLVSLTNDRVQKTIDTLVKESKLSEQEGARIMDDLKKNTDTKRQEMEKQFQGLASRLMKGAGLATNADVEELKRTVKGGSKASAPAAKSASSSASAKKPAAAASKAAAPAKKAPAAKPAASAKPAAPKAAAAKKPAPKVSGNTTSAGSSDGGNS